MFKHVGLAHYPACFDTARRLLADEGLILLHTIGTHVATTHTDPWIDKYIFPECKLPAASELAAALEGHLLIEDWHSFGQDYDRTLMAWWEKFERARPQLAPRHDERLHRMFRYYLLSSAAFFRSRQGQLWQLVLAKRRRSGTYRTLRQPQMLSPPGPIAMLDAMLALYRTEGLMDPGYLAAGAVAALLSSILLLAALQALLRGRVLLFSARLLVGGALLAAGIAVWTLAFGIQGYRALTREEVAAVITIVPQGAQRFEARVRLADGSEQRHNLAGDEVYVDAQILKWKPAANLIGLHTAYSLDRIAGRYRSLAQEQSAPHTVHALAAPRPIDLFELRNRYPLLAPLVDAEYGSATFVAAAQPRQIEIRVSTTGLMARDVAIP